jgi:hypothetical protein
LHEGLRQRQPTEQRIINGGEKEKQTREAALLSVVRRLHDDLDAAVFAACGWPPTLTEAEILEQLVALNREWAKEEASGLVRWLRLDHQNPGGTRTQQTQLAVGLLS